MNEGQKNIHKFVLGAKNGDSEAFGELYEHFFDSIFKYIYRRVSDLHTAEDLTEEVFMKAFQSIGSLSKPELFVSWIYTIARNKLTDYYRQNSANPNEGSLDEAWHIADSSPLPDSKTNTAMEVKALFAAMENLPQRYREVLELKFIQELETEEIAKILKKNNGAVRIMQMRAIERLKKILHSRNNG